MYGAGCVVRKSAYNKLSEARYKQMFSDRKGSSLSTGGDYELCYTIALLGYDIWYDKRLKFKHFIQKERLTWDYCAQFYKEGANSFEVLIPYRIRVNRGSKSLASFNLGFIQTFFYYVNKQFPLLIKYLKLPHNSEEALKIKIELLSLKYKLCTIKNYYVMRQNFLKILRFEQFCLTS